MNQKFSIRWSHVIRYLNTGHLTKGRTTQWRGKDQYETDETRLDWCIRPWISSEESFVGQSLYYERREHYETNEFVIIRS